MSVLAKAAPDEVAACWDAVEPKPAYTVIRAPETGLVMVRGRAGGSGSPFNLGEITVTRCAVALECGAVGQAYVAGRDRQHAEMAAVFDALLQTRRDSHELKTGVIEELESLQRRRRLDDGVKTAATRVEFFTMVRGED